MCLHVTPGHNQSSLPESNNKFQAVSNRILHIAHMKEEGNPDTGEYTGDNSKSPAGRSITPEQFHNRMILRRAMLSHGFKPLDTEWWHFTLKDEPFPDTYFTFPVK